MQLNDTIRQEIVNQTNQWNRETRGYKGDMIDIESIREIEKNPNPTHPVAAFILARLKEYEPEMKRRNFTRIDQVLSVYKKLDFQRKQGQYIDIALVHETPIALCAIASRLSHEAWDKAGREADQALLAKLQKAGDEHAKSLRGHLFYILLEAPRYMWPEMDTYTIGVQSLGSTSTMHREAKQFSGDDLVEFKENLTEGTLQCRMKIFSEPALLRIVHQRKSHRLPDWHEFCDFVEQII